MFHDAYSLISMAYNASFIEYKVPMREFNLLSKAGYLEVGY